MKKFISIVLMMFALVATYAQTTQTYYVTVDGVDTNDGLSEANATTLTAAVDYCEAEGTASTYIINVGEGNIPFNNLAIKFARTEEITLKIVGAGADKTYYQRLTDSAFVSDLYKGGVYMGKAFQNPQNTGGLLNFEVEDFMFRNFGGNTDALYGTLVTLESKTDVNVTFRRCNVIRSVARQGALIQAGSPNAAYSITMEDCNFSEIYTFNRKNKSFSSPIFIGSGNSFTAKNCVFSSFNKINPLNPTSFLDVKNGSVITFQSSIAGASLELINNTFIGDSIAEPGMTVDQSSVYINTSVADLPVTIANNIFIGNGTVAPVSHYDVYVDSTSSALELNDCSNNVMNSQQGLVDTVNTVNSDFTYISSEVAFTMDGAFPELFATTTGVNFVKANGTEVFQKGLVFADVTTDIEGTTRNATTPCVGAYEALSGNTPTQLGPDIESAISVYPNPTTGLVTILGVEAGASVEVYSQLGQRVLSSILNGNDLDLSNVNGGMYILRVTDASGNSGVQRIVVR